jgi:hypothetical protein
MVIRQQSRRLFFLYSLPLHIVIAFGPSLESLKGGYGSRMSRTSMAEYDEREERESQNYKRTGGRFLPYHDDPRMQHDLDFCHGSLVHTGNFRVDSIMFGIDNPFDILPSSTDNNVIDLCNGDDCEECSIPEDYKRVDNPVDVLMYIGIQRAKPIVATTFGD